MQSTKSQRKTIYRLCKYDKAMKEEMVQWITGNKQIISTTAISFDQANKIIIQLGGTAEKLEYWAYFDKTNKSHKKILSLCITYGMRKEDPTYGSVADLDALSMWLHSTRCPVNKPLKEMNRIEVSKIINALNAMIKKKFK